MSHSINGSGSGSGGGPTRLAGARSTSSRPLFVLPREETKEQDTTCRQWLKRRPKNVIKTTKFDSRPWSINFVLYGLLYEVFQRKANLYFLFIALIPIIPGVSSHHGQLPTMAALVFVIALQSVQSIFEDYKRYRVDVEKNDSNCCVYDDSIKKWKNVKLRDVKAGDLVKVEVETAGEIPCDMLLLTTSDAEGGTCYVETSALDGETRLKPKYALQATRHRLPRGRQPGLHRQQSNGDGDGDEEHAGNHNVNPLTEPGQCLPQLYHDIKLEVEPPNPQLHIFSGAITRLLPSSTEAEAEAGEEGENPLELDTKQRRESSFGWRNFSSFESGVSLDDAALSGTPLPISKDQFIPFGSQLRKTEWIVGVALYLGPETKLMMNRNKPQFKRSTAEKLLNRLLVIVLLFELALCIACAISLLLLDQHNDEVWYLVGGVNASRPADDAPGIVRFIVGFLRFLLLFNNFIPISIYVTLELIRSGQSLLMEHDLLLYNASIDQRLVVRSSSLNEELGQVTHILCDKTGTLTKNKMTFLKFSIGGTIFGDRQSELDRSLSILRGEVLVAPSTNQDGKMTTTNELSPVRGIAKKGAKESLALPSFGVGGASSRTGDSSTFTNTSLSADWTSNSMFMDAATHGGSGAASSHSDLFDFEDQRMPQLRYRRLPEADKIDKFFSALSLCHSVALHGSNYESETPDEATLCTAAAYFGYRFTGKSSSGAVGATSSHTMLSVERGTAGHVIQYELLDQLDYTPQRKRSTVVVQEIGSDVVRIITKGADDVMVPRFMTGGTGGERKEKNGELKEEDDDDDNDELKRSIKAQERMADQGLRCMMVGEKSIPVEEFYKWVVDLNSIVDEHQQQVQPELDKTSSSNLGNEPTESTSTSVFALLSYSANAIAKLVGQAPQPTKFSGATAANASFRSTGSLHSQQEEEAAALAFRNKALEHIDKLESGLTVLGCTGLDDQLQDNVAITLYRLRKANVKSWIVTGDHGTTAKKIAEATGLYRSEDHTELNFGPKEPIASVRSQIRTLSAQRHATTGTSNSTDNLHSSDDIGNMSVVPGGTTAAARSNSSLNSLRNTVVFMDGRLLLNLVSLLSDEDDEHRQQQSFRQPAQQQQQQGQQDDDSAECTGYGLPSAGSDERQRHLEDFYSILNECHSLIISRTSPAIKNSLIRLVRSCDGKAITLALGDGGNDVPMIQAAHVGVGIFGNEGNHAVNAADYAIPEFQCLERLVLVHGRANYARITKVMNYFFYKNVLLCMMQFLYALHNRFSGQSLFEPVTATMYNVIFTSIPCIVLGILDRDILNTDWLKRVPILYLYSQQGQGLNLIEFLRWQSEGVVHALVVYFVFFYGWSNLMFHQGHTIDEASLGLIVFALVVLIGTVRLGFAVRSWTMFHYLAFLGSLFFGYGYYFVFGEIQSSISHQLFWLARQIGFKGEIWIYSATAVLFCMVPGFWVWYASYRTLPLKTVSLTHRVQLADSIDNQASTRPPATTNLQADIRSLMTEGQQGPKDVFQSKGEMSFFEAMSSAKASPATGTAAEGRTQPMEPVVDGPSTAATNSRGLAVGLFSTFTNSEMESEYRKWQMGNLRGYIGGLTFLFVATLIVFIFDMASPSESRSDQTATTNRIAFGVLLGCTFLCWLLFVVLRRYSSLYYHEVMCLLTIVGFSCLSVAYFQSCQDDPSRHPVFFGVSMIGLLVAIRPPLPHAFMYMLFALGAYNGWYQAYRVSPWKTADIISRVLEVVTVAVTGVINLAYGERFYRQVFLAVRSTDDAILLAEQEESRTWRLLREVLPQVIVYQIRHAKRGLSEFSVLFPRASYLQSDIVKFTNFSSQHSPAVIIEMLNHMFTKFDRLAVIYQVEKIKTIGDAYICVAGIPIPDEHHQERIVLVGLGLVEAITTLNAEGTPQLPSLSLAIRVGVASGPLLGGVVGLQKVGYDVFGETVAVAVDMESSGLPQRVQCPEGMAKELEPQFSVDTIEGKYFIAEKRKHTDGPSSSDKNDIVVLGGDDEDVDLDLRREVMASSTRNLVIRSSASFGERPSGGLIVASSSSELSLSPSAVTQVPSSASHSPPVAIAVGGTAPISPAEAEEEPTTTENDLARNQSASIRDFANMAVPPTCILQSEEEEVYDLFEDADERRAQAVQRWKDFNGEPKWKYVGLKFKDSVAEAEFRRYLQQVAAGRAEVEQLIGAVIFALLGSICAAQYAENRTHPFIIMLFVLCFVHVLLALTKQLTTVLKEDTTATEDNENDDVEMSEEQLAATRGEAGVEGGGEDEADPAEILEAARSTKSRTFSRPRTVSGSSLSNSSLDATLRQEHSSRSSFSQTVRASLSMFLYTTDRISSAFESVFSIRLAAAFAIFSALVTYATPIVFLAVLDTSEAGTVLVFVVIVSVTHLFGFLHVTFPWKILAIVHQFVALTIELWWYRMVKRHWVMERYGGDYLALVVGYLLLIFYAWGFEKGVRQNFIAAKKMIIRTLTVESMCESSDKLLYNVLPPLIVLRLKAHPGRQLVEEFTDASAMFVYTNIESVVQLHADPVYALRQVNRLIFSLDNLCVMFGVEKIKTTPFLVVGGVPERNATAKQIAERLCSCALSMQKALQNFNGEGSGVSVEMKIGIHSGTVCAGVLGTTKLQYDVFGDTVNLASRLTSSAQWGVIQLSAATQRLVSNRFVIEDFGVHTLKGKGEQRIYRLLPDEEQLMTSSSISQFFSRQQSSESEVFRRLSTIARKAKASQSFSGLLDVPPSPLGDRAPGRLMLKRAPRREEEGGLPSSRLAFEERDASAAEQPSPKTGDGDREEIRVLPSSQDEVVVLAPGISGKREGEAIVVLSPSE